MKETAPPILTDKSSPSPLIVRAVVGTGAVALLAAVGLLLFLHGHQRPIQTVVATNELAVHEAPAAVPAEQVPEGEWVEPDPKDFSQSNTLSILLSSLHLGRSNGAVARFSHMANGCVSCAQCRIPQRAKRRFGFPPQDRGAGAARATRYPDPGDQSGNVLPGAGTGVCLARSIHWNQRRSVVAARQALTAQAAGPSSAVADPGAGAGRASKKGKSPLRSNARQRLMRASNRRPCAVVGSACPQVRTSSLRLIDRNEVLDAPG